MFLLRAFSNQQHLHDTGLLTINLDIDIIIISWFILKCHDDGDDGHSGVKGHRQSNKYIL